MNEKKFSPGAEESLRLSQEAAGEPVSYTHLTLPTKRT